MKRESKDKRLPSEHFCSALMIKEDGLEPGILTHSDTYVSFLKPSA